MCVFMWACNFIDVYIQKITQLKCVQLKEISQTELIHVSNKLVKIGNISYALLKNVSTLALNNLN